MFANPVDAGGIGYVFKGNDQQQGTGADTGALLLAGQHKGTARTAININEETMQQVFSR